MELEKFKDYEIVSANAIYGGTRIETRRPQGNFVNILQGQVAYTTDTGD